MADIIHQNNIILNADLRETVKLYINNTVKTNTFSYIPFPAVASARAPTDENNIFYNKVTWESVCACGQKTIKAVITEGRTMETMYALELKHIFLDFSFTNTIDLHKIVTADKILKKETSVPLDSNPSHKCIGLYDLTTALEKCRKYQVNVHYYGLFNSITSINDISWSKDNALTGIAVMNLSEEALTENQMLVRSETTSKDDDTSPLLYLSLTSSKLEIISLVYIPDYYTSIVSSVNNGIIYKNNIITSLDVIKSILAILDDWTYNLDKNKVIIDIHICHYNCYADATNPSSPVTSGECANIVTGFIEGGGTGADGTSQTVTKGEIVAAGAPTKINTGCKWSIRKVAGIEMFGLIGSYGPAFTDKNKESKRERTRLMVSVGGSGKCTDEAEYYEDSYSTRVSLSKSYNDASNSTPVSLATCNVLINVKKCAKCSDNAFPIVGVNGEEGEKFINYCANAFCKNYDGATELEIYEALGIISE